MRNKKIFISGIRRILPQGQSKRRTGKTGTGPVKQAENNSKLCNTQQQHWTESPILKYHCRVLLHRGGTQKLLEGALYNMSQQKTRNTFSGKLGFVLSAAGSAVGLGNIWRFPYLAAKYGGGIFLLVYLILVATFGYTMIVCETALGRMTQKSPVGAYRTFGHTTFLNAGGWINAVIPILIVPYYSVIGGWVLKYLYEYCRSDPEKMAADDYFVSYMTNGRVTEFWFLVFAVITIVIIYMGVQNGIERVSKTMMPLLVVLAVAVAVYSVTRPGALAGVRYFLVPNLSNVSWMTVVSAMGQMFYSLSIAMGILITFGSYMKKDIDIEGTTGQVEIFDTLIAILAGLMVIPAVFAFNGGDPAKLKAGPSLMFISLPQVFASMGMGNIVGVAFFLLVALAALTSSIALLESAVSTFEDELGWGRKKATMICGAIMIGLGTLSVLGYSAWSGFTVLRMQILDFFDFLTNSVMMPVAAFCNCILVFRVIGTGAICEEIESSSKFRRKKVFLFVLKYLAPLFTIIILVSSVLNAFGVIHM